jgi:hypothetical protein
MLDPYPPYPIPPILEYGEEYAEPIPPYGEATPPSLFAPYGEYADAFLFTADISVDGRSGIAGALEDVVVEEDKVEGCELPTEAPVEIPVDDGKAAELANMSVIWKPQRKEL